ncbi:nucleotide-binding universal stress UspA family protein [Paraburkholderia bannensis]|uniref:Nucleotide-binding universal stress UspA family protein n=1 Tax=Paraburkholderia bannensis TaxID=765414 RepID=A0A7W9U6J7_9BURK|nr:MULTISPECIES: universal stress protein [Paraburkholderia]MBB3261886.1 nucleotide-binding universal stress UspA family protein [Paraburkholderia sp. WP4_3_2]MBB6106880.1 nucleotide-binding universal stress UspA family protein [Paraburkholderia bannensis]
MSYKTLMVHLDSSTRANARVSLALKLARSFGSHLAGVFAAFEPHPREFYVMAGTADYYDAHRKLRAEQRAAIERLFRAELERAQVAGTLVDAEKNTDIVSSLLHHSRSADLTIIGQANPNDPETFVSDHFSETVVLGTGGPVLLVPNTGYFETVGTRVLIGWNGSREAARAVHDAIPFIVSAAHVTIATSSSTFSPAPSQASCSELAAMLARHGATSIDISRFDRHAAETTGDALLNFAVDGGFDLLVMGAYGHARLQELVLGGATRSILLTATLPVLMSH